MDEIGYEMPVFLGAMRPKLLLNMDPRILFLVALSIVGVLFSFWMVALTIVLGVVGVALGTFSPYAVDEIFAYMDFRSFSMTAAVPADVFIGHADPKFVLQHRQTRNG